MRVYMRYENESEFRTLQVPEGKDLDDFLDREYEERKKNAAPGEVVERRTLQEALDELWDPEREGVGNNYIRRNENKQKRHTTVFSEMPAEDEDDGDFLSSYSNFDEDGFRVFKGKDQKYKQQSVRKRMASGGSNFKGPLEAFIEKEGRERLLAAVNRLNDEQIELLERYFFEEHQVKEIAKDEEVSESAITQRKATILKKLKKILKKKP